MSIPQTPILTLPPQVTLRTTDVAPPVESYCDRNTQLVVNIWTSVSCSVGVYYRFLQPNGAITPGQFVFNPTANRTLNQYVMPMTEGFFLGVTAWVIGASVLRGQCFVKVFLTQGAPAAAIYGMVLCSGYVSDTDSLSFPPGTIEPSVSGLGWSHDIALGNPAAGAEFVIAVPVNAIWKVHAVHGVLSTSAAVAARLPQLQYLNGSIYTLVSPAAANQAASLAGHFTWMSGAGATAPVTANQAMTLPEQMVLSPGTSVQSVTLNLQAGDQWSALGMNVEEWLRP